MEYYSIIASKNYMCRHIYTYIYICIHIFNPLSSPPGVRRFNIFFIYNSSKKKCINRKNSQQLVATIYLRNIYRCQKHFGSDKNIYRCQKNIHVSSSATAFYLQ